MTRLSAPFKIKKAFSETTVMSVDASGNMQFDGDMSMDGNSTIGGSVDAVGPISSGSAAATGFTMMAQQTVVPASTGKIKVAQLPEGADVIDWNFYVTTAFGTAAAHIEIRAGTSAAETLLGAITLDGADEVTTAGMKRPAETTAGQTTLAGWNGVTGAGAVFHVAVTAVSGAVASAASGIFTIQYIHKV